MEIDRLGVHQLERADPIDDADDGIVVLHIHDCESIVRDRPEARFPRGEVRRRPVVAPVQLLELLELLQELHDGVCHLAEARAVRLRQRKLERGALEVLREDVLVLGVYDGILGRLPEEILAVPHEVLVDRVVVADEHRERLVGRTPSAAGLLPRACDGAGETDDDRGIETPDVNAQLESVRARDAHQLS